MILLMLLFARVIDFNAVGPFNEVDGTAVKLFLATFSSCKTVFFKKKNVLNE